MTSKWDRVSASVRRAHSDMEFRQVRVFNHTKTYNDATGSYEYIRSEDGNSPVEMELREPTQPKTTDTGGTESEVDAEGYLADDTGVSIVSRGESDHPTEFEDTRGDGYYVCRELFNEGQGILKATLVEQ